MLGGFFVAYRRLLAFERYRVMVFELRLYLALLLTELFGGGGYAVMTYVSLRDKEG